jgi:uncharacterized protein (UPF0548 family)
MILKSTEPDYLPSFIAALCFKQAQQLILSHGRIYSRWNIRYHPEDITIVEKRVLFGKYFYRSSEVCRLRRDFT